jgi:hypothetical protein
MREPIIEKLPEETSQRPLTEALRRLLDARIAEREAYPEDVEPWETARDEILHNL